MRNIIHCATLAANGHNTQPWKLGIISAFLNQPIEIADLRGQFQSAIGLGKPLPQFLVHLGYAAAMPKSLRRPVEQVLIEL